MTTRVNTSVTIKLTEDEIQEAISNYLETHNSVYIKHGYMPYGILEMI